MLRLLFESRVLRLGHPSPGSSLTEATHLYPEVPAHVPIPSAPTDVPFRLRRAIKSIRPRIELSSQLQLFFWSSKPSYKPLCSLLSTHEAASEGEQVLSESDQPVCNSLASLVTMARTHQVTARES